MTNILLKEADFSDVEFLWYLRNQPEVYKYFKNPEPVKWEEHINWILPILLQESDKKLLIILDSKNPVGQIRFDYNNSQEAEISISISKQFQGKGFGSKSLRKAVQWFKKNNKKAEKLIAEIYEDNLSSRKLFEKTGFKFETKEGKLLKYFFKYD